MPLLLLKENLKRAHASIREAKQNNVNENVLETETKRPKSG